MTDSNWLTPGRVAAGWDWLCHSRRKFPAHADIWNLRVQREQQLPAILAALRAGSYRFSPLQVVTKADGEEVALWSAADALVLKWMTMALQDLLPVHRACTHVKGHGGHKAAVRQAHDWVAGGHYAFVCKTDIRGYYANIDKMQLLHLLSRYVLDDVKLDLLARFLDYSVEKGGNFHTPRTGIPRGCPLSPLLAGFHLFELDRNLAGRKGVRYLRFMDDLLILTRTRWQLKRAVARMNAWFAQGGLEQHPDKTFIGRIERGFDWLGYQFDAKGLCGVAARALMNLSHKLHRLLELARNCASPERESAQLRVVEYQKRWVSWCLGGLDLWPNQTKPWLVRTPVGITG